MMIVDKIHSNFEDENCNIKDQKDLNYKEKGYEINSVEALYDFSSSVFKSNWQFVISIFNDWPESQMPPPVYARHTELLTQTKAAVKRVMEEATSKKLIYYDNITVNAFCAAVENCTLDGLYRRTIGLFEDSPSMGLLKKISKDCEEASHIINKLKNFDQHAPYSAVTNGRFFSESDCNTGVKSSSTISLPSTLSGWFHKTKVPPMKFSWIKSALIEKKLVSIVEYLISHHIAFYNENSIMSSSLSGRLLLDLIAGPCSLDFSLVKPCDHIWNDPDATELIDRHKIHSNQPWTTTSGDRNIQRSGLHITRNGKNKPNLKIHYNTSLSLRINEPISVCSSSGFFGVKSSSCAINSANSNHSIAKEYVESLHQSMKNVLLYGKNNVVMQPKEELNEMQGYLSLHQYGSRLKLKWTPNQLMNHQNTPDSESTDNTSQQSDSPLSINNFMSQSKLKLQWDSALSINMENIVYLHCHQKDDEDGVLTLICRDGVQHPPLHFPAGGHLLQFLICLENGLAPNAVLDPPLLKINEEKHFPKLSRPKSIDAHIPEENVKSKRRRSTPFSLLSSFNRSLKTAIESSLDTKSEGSHSADDLESDICNSDFVFRIVYRTSNPSAEWGSDSSRDIVNNVFDNLSNSDGLLFKWDSKDDTSNSSLDASISSLCSTMRRQILSRAFYGWLQYYRNLRTVRTQFSRLVLPGTVSFDVPCDASDGLTEDIWKRYMMNKDISVEEIYRLIYFGGCQENIRNQVWPRILGHYDWVSNQNSEIDATTELQYEKSLSQWKALEVIIVQRENETNVSLIQAATGQALKRQPEIQESFSFDSPSLLFLEPESNHVKYDRNTLNVSNCDPIPSKDFYSSDTASADDKTVACQDFVFSEEQIATMADNLHRIDKDVDRCDRNYTYFSSTGKNRFKGRGNLKKLRNIMITWVWENTDIGYVQGMCDLLAPLLVVLDSESLTYACFSKLMSRMIKNFPQMGSKMDDNLSMMALLLQITDRSLYDHMCPDGEVTSLYVSYRWFLLDFKRELRYSDVFAVWETIWSSRYIASKHFNLFLALSLLQYYRDIILDNDMEYTDIIKFFNEMAEKHDVQRLLFIARELIESIRDLLQPK